MDWEQSVLSNEKDGRFLEKFDEDMDLAFALSLQEELNDETTQEVLSKESQTSLAKSSSSVPSLSLGIIDEEWELIDPNPDVHALFLQFNSRFFWGRLQGVEVRWAARMTLCAGVCYYEGHGGLCSVALSSPLLKLRPRKDLVETLLHEMIHAYLFITENNRDHGGHGPQFLSHMYRINKEAGTNITVYHNFHDEVIYFQKHWWKCNGPCQNRRPFFGVVKRAMNRAPGPNDRWWADHQASCGGTFTKIHEPEPLPAIAKKILKNAKRKQPKESKASKNTADIKSFFPNNPSTSKAGDIPSHKHKKAKGKADIHTINSVFEKEDNLVSVNGSKSSKTIVPTDSLPNIQAAEAFTGKGFTLGSSSSSTQPKSLLSQIRKEIGYPDSRSVGKQPVAKVNPSEKTFKLPSPSTSGESSTANKKQKKHVKSSSNKKGSPKKSSSTPGKKLKQSSIDTFVSPERPSGDDLSKVSNAKSNKKSPKKDKNKVAISTSNKKSPKKDLNKMSNANSNKRLPEKDLNKVSNATPPENNLNKFSNATSSMRSPVNKPNIVSNATSNAETMIPFNCPFCFIDVPYNAINAHLDECDKFSKATTSMGPPANDMNIVSDATSNTEAMDNLKTVSCPICFADVPSDTINAHLDECSELSNATSSMRPPVNDMNIVSNATSNAKAMDSCKTVSCPVCFVDVPSDTINVHLDECLNPFV